MLEKEIDVYGDEEFAGFTEEKRTELVTEGFVALADDETIEEEKEVGDTGETFGPSDDLAQEEGAVEGKNLNDDEVVQAIVEEAIENVEEPEKELGQDD
jgi:hypothetical protein